ncbi:MAG: hypothetical protein ORN85_03710, partial [Sediminibacterium sp.]|nr:hypothetical protein [Sediminibacterium sp.]
HKDPANNEQTSNDRQNASTLTAVWQKWRFRSPQTLLWLIKVWFSVSTIVVKIATFGKPQTFSGQPKRRHRK